MALSSCNSNLSLTLVTIEDTFSAKKGTKSHRMSQVSQFDLESSIDQKDDTAVYSCLRVNNGENEMFTIIDEFFSITEAFERENLMANRIKSAYKRLKQRRCLRQFHKAVYQSIGYTVEMTSLPNDLLLYILSFLEKRELYTVCQLSRDFNELAFDQSLWKSYQLRNQKKNYGITKVLPKILNKLTNLQVLNFSFCASIDEQAIAKIAPFVNKGTLKELYLDGCEKINDSALSVLTGRDPNFLQADTHFFKENFGFERYPSAVKKHKGLELLSLSECRNIHCNGIMKLDKLQNLRTLNLLG